MTDISRLRDEHLLRISMLNAVLENEKPPLASSAPCTLTATHSPGFDYTEIHHVIPRAWQRHWQPPLPWPYPSQYSGDNLWDGRDVPLCRTHHGNVHYLLVAIMQAWQAQGGGDFDKATSTARSKIHALGLPFSSVEAATAMLAMERYSAIGGDLMDLCTQGIYGYI